MNVGHTRALFFGGALLMNAVPHAVAGAMGRAFRINAGQSPA